MAKNENQKSPITVLTIPFPMQASLEALEALSKSERFDAVRYKEELRLLLERDMKERGPNAMKIAVLDDPPLIRSFKIILSHIEDELKKKEEYESHNREKLVFF